MEALLTFLMYLIFVIIGFFIALYIYFVVWEEIKYRCGLISLAIALMFTKLEAKQKWPIVRGMLYVAFFKKWEN